MRGSFVVCMAWYVWRGAYAMRMLGGVWYGSVDIYFQYRYHFRQPIFSDHRLNVIDFFVSS